MYNLGKKDKVLEYKMYIFEFEDGRFLALNEDATKESEMYLSVESASSASQFSKSARSIILSDMTKLGHGYLYIHDENQMKKVVREHECVVRSVKTKEIKPQ